MQYSRCQGCGILASDLHSGLCANCERESESSPGSHGNAGSERPRNDWMHTPPEIPLSTSTVKAGTAAPGSARFAEERFAQCLRERETVLAFSEGVSMGIQGLPEHLGGSDQRAWFLATDARILALTEKSGEVQSSTWSEMAWMRVYPRRRNWFFQWQHVLQEEPYEPDLIEAHFARILEQVQSSQIRLRVLESEACVPVHLGASTSELGQIFGMQRFRCLSCGTSLIFNPSEQSFLQCRGCLRFPDSQSIVKS